MSTTVAPEKILRDLAALWVEEGKQGSAGVLRACSMTLVVMAEESDDAAALGETLAALMPEHPARTILVRLRAGSERTLSERVYQQCWMPFGQRRQICCEQIELVASDAALGDLPSVLLPLVVADLPVILWCRSPRLSAMPEFGDIARLATKVVLDSAAFDEPEAAMARMAEAQTRGVRIADLAWTRVTRWREMLARVFENREMLSRLSGVAAVKVDCGARHETSAWYMAAWTRNALAAASLAPAVTVVRNSEAIHVELSGPGLRVALRCEGGTLAVTVNDLTNQTHLEPASDYLLMREELGVARRDTVFERTLSTAARLAVSSKTE